MPRLTTCACTPADTAALAPVATALGRALRLGVRHHPLPDDPDAQVAAVLAEAEDPEVELVVLPSPAGSTPRLVSELMLGCPKPVVLVRTGDEAPRPDVLSRVLVPLDGTEASAATVAGALALFAASGLDVVVLHVFEEATVPKFWDQAVHARQSWEQEFLARFCPEPTARLELRTGSPGDTILSVAESEDADLIALGWSQPAAGGRARTVWATVAGARVPVMLLPVPADEQAPVSGAPGAASRS